MVNSHAITLRAANAGDRAFIMELSPSLAGVANLHWHKDAVVQNFQDAYIIEMLDTEDCAQITLIAERADKPVGFVYACQMEDEISGETCGSVPLLCVSENARGSGAGGMLMEAAEGWAKAQGYRLLHLEVFANNSNAQAFYEKRGFEGETIVMIKPLSAG